MVSDIKFATNLSGKRRNSDDELNYSDEDDDNIALNSIGENERGDEDYYENKTSDKKKEVRCCHSTVHSLFYYFSRT